MYLLQRALGFTQTSYGLDLDDLKRVEMNRQKLPLIDLIHLNRFLYVAARDALDRGDKERFLSAAKLMPLLALSMERESPLIATLVGIACDKMLVDLIKLAIARPQTDHLTLDEVEQLIPDNDLRAVWRRTITSEFALAPLRRDQATEPLPTEQERAALDRSLLSADAATRSAAIVAFTEVLDTAFGSSPDWSATQERRITEATKASVETPNLVRAAGRFQHTLSARHLARLALALRREAMRTGSYPATLASLPVRPARPFRRDACGTVAQSGWVGSPHYPRWCLQEVLHGRTATRTEHLAAPGANAPLKGQEGHRYSLSPAQLPKTGSGEDLR